jgi:hypothetical protein
LVERNERFAEMLLACDPSHLGGGLELADERGGMGRSLVRPAAPSKAPTWPILRAMASL